MRRGTRYFLYACALFLVVGWFALPLMTNMGELGKSIHLAIDIVTPLGLGLGALTFWIFYDVPTERVFKVKDGEVVDYARVRKPSFEEARHHDGGLVEKSDDKDNRVWLCYDWNLDSKPMEFWGTWEASADPDELIGSKEKERVNKYHKSLVRIAMMAPKAISRADQYARDAYYEGVYIQGSEVRDLSEDGRPSIFDDIEAYQDRMRDRIQEARKENGNANDKDKADSVIDEVVSSGTKTADKLRAHAPLIESESEGGADGK